MTFFSINSLTVHHGIGNNIMKDLNIEQITPDPVMADPELFCLCG